MEAHPLQRDGSSKSCYTHLSLSACSQHWWNKAEGLNGEQRQYEYHFDWYSWIRSSATAIRSLGGRTDPDPRAGSLMPEELIPELPPGTTAVVVMRELTSSIAKSNIFGSTEN